jgi:hypothetical protein
LKFQISATKDTIFYLYNLKGLSSFQQDLALIPLVILPSYGGGGEVGASSDAIEVFPEPELWLGMARLRGKLLLGLVSFNFVGWSLALGDDDILAFLPAILTGKKTR